MSPVHLEQKESGLKKSRLSFNYITFVISILSWGQLIHKHGGKKNHEIHKQGKQRLSKKYKIPS